MQKLWSLISIQNLKQNTEFFPFFSKGEPCFLGMDLPEQTIILIL